MPLLSFSNDVHNKLLNVHLFKIMRQKFLSCIFAFNLGFIQRPNGIGTSYSMGNKLEFYYKYWQDISYLLDTPTAILNMYFIVFKIFWNYQIICIEYKRSILHLHILLWVLLLFKLLFSIKQARKGIFCKNMTKTG